MAVPRATCAFSARRVGCSDRNTQPGTRKSRLLAVPLQAVLACARLPPRLGFSIGHVARVRQRTGLHGQCCIVFDGSIADAAAAFEWLPGIARLGTNRPAVLFRTGALGTMSTSTGKIAACRRLDSPLQLTHHAKGGAALVQDTVRAEALEAMHFDSDTTKTASVPRRPARPGRRGSRSSTSAHARSNTHQRLGDPHPRRRNPFRKRRQPPPGPSTAAAAEPSSRSSSSSISSGRCNARGAAPRGCWFELRRPWKPP